MTAPENQQTVAKSTPLTDAFESVPLLRQWSGMTPEWRPAGRWMSQAS